VHNISNLGPSHELSRVITLGEPTDALEIERAKLKQPISADQPHE
jgi:hypothetical protein